MSGHRSDSQEMRFKIGRWTAEHAGFFLVRIQRHPIDSSRLRTLLGYRLGWLGASIKSWRWTVKSVVRRLTTIERAPVFL
jgi:hypothetical protein